MEGLTWTFEGRRGSIRAGVVLGIGLSALIAVGLGRSSLRSAEAQVPGARAARRRAVAKWCASPIVPDDWTVRGRFGSVTGEPARGVGVARLPQQCSI